MRVAIVTGLIVGIAACGDGATSSDQGLDTEGPADSSARNGGPDGMASGDASRSPDVEPVDSARVDAVSVDAMPPDVGRPDVGPHDASSPGATVWTQQTSNGRVGLARYSYSGAIDANPVAAPGSFVFTQNDNDTTTGFPALAMPHGVIGQTSAISVVKYRIGVGAWKTAAYQDSVHYDLHIVGNGNLLSSAGQAPLYAMMYWRFQIDHDASGQISGLTNLAEFEMRTAAGGTTDAWSASNYAVWEVVDGAGNHRLLMGIEKDASGSATDPVDCYVGQTTVAAGVSPTGVNDWVGLDDVSHDPTYVGTLPSINVATASYVTDLYGAQHAVSGKFELFVSDQNHGEAGAHAWVTLTPSATAWTAADSNGTSLTPPPPVHSYALHSYSNVAGLGQSCIPGIHDDVWWAWDDGTVTRISRINSDGTVSWNPLPSLGGRLDWSSFRGLQVAPDETVAIIDVPSDTLDATIRGRRYAGGAWGSWFTLGSLHGETTYFANPLQGLAKIDGSYWMAVASVDGTAINAANGHTDDESTVAAMALASY
jgi:hypothetical protein